MRLPNMHLMEAHQQLLHTCRTYPATHDMILHTAFLVTVEYLNCNIIYTALQKLNQLNCQKKENSVQQQTTNVVSIRLLVVLTTLCQLLVLWIL